MATFLAGLDWQAILFLLGVFFVVLYVFKLDADKSTNFRIVHFITDKDGTGNSASLAYVSALLVSTWAMFYLTTHGKLEDWFFTSYIGVFVGGGVIRAHLGSKERIAAQQQPPVETPK